MLVNTRTIRIEWGDCDPAGIVFFPRYLAYFDGCTAGLFERAGLPKAQLLRDHGILGFPAVEVRTRFLKPSTFGDEVTIESSIVRWGRSSFNVEHRLLRVDGLAVEGFETRVWATGDPHDPSKLKSQETPADIVRRFLTDKERRAAM